MKRYVIVFETMGQRFIINSSSLNNSIRDTCIDVPWEPVRSQTSLICFEFIRLSPLAFDSTSAMATVMAFSKRAALREIWGRL